MFWMYENKKTRNLEYVLFEGNTKHCNKIIINVLTWCDFRKKVCRT